MASRPRLSANSVQLVSWHLGAGSRPARERTNKPSREAITPTPDLAGAADSDRVIRPRSSPPGSESQWYHRDPELGLTERSVSPAACGAQYERGSPFPQPRYPSLADQTSTESTTAPISSDQASDTSSLSPAAPIQASSQAFSTPSLFAAPPAPPSEVSLQPLYHSLLQAGFDFPLDHIRKQRGHSLVASAERWCRLQLISASKVAQATLEAVDCRSGSEEWCTAKRALAFADGELARFDHWRDNIWHQ